LDPGIRDPQRLFLPGHRLYPDVGPPVKRLLVRALNHRLLFDHFAPAIAILASQSDGKGSLVKEVLTAARVGLAARGLGDLDPFRVEKCLVTRPNGILLFLRAGRRKLILRIPLEGSVTLRRYQRNFWTLQALHTPEDPLGRVVPAGFLADSVAGQPFFVEEALPGEPGDARALAKTGDLSRALWEAVRFLTDLHRRSRQRGRLVGKWLEEAVHRPCRQLEAFVCSRMTLKQIRIIHDYLVKVLAGQILPRVWCHGDFKLDNLLFADGRTLTGVIDWDCSSEMGLPGLDLCHFIARKRSSLTGKTMVQALADGLGDRLPDPEDEDLYREYLAAVEVPPDLRFPLSVLCWVHQAGFRLDWPERVLFPSSIENMIGDYPRRVCQLLIQHG
jgi:aminoglycoside phosphotransferase (APT) family kinase protein